jgi:uncharacterized protein (TIGR03067 family)
MTTRHLPALLGCVLLAGAGCGRPSQSSGPDRDNLQGSWQAERVELGGKVSADESMRGLTLSFDGDKVVTEVGGVRHEGTFSLDASRMPRQIDFKPTDGNKTDKELHGVYVFESDNNLRICFSQNARPGGFNTQPNSEAIAFELRRNPPREPILKLDVAELLEKCKRNRSVAADTYRNTVVQVKNGKVMENKDGRIRLTGNGGQDYIECTFNHNYKSELNRATELKERKTVTLRGTFNGAFEARNRGGTYVQLLNCEVVDVADGEMP